MFRIFRSLHHLIRLLRSQWMSPEEIEAIQKRKLKAVLRHAYENVDYYRRLFDSAGVKPEEINDQGDLLKIPITTKKQLQALSPEEITAKGIRLDDCITFKTGGSTGIPLDILVDRKELRFRGAILMRAFLASGYRITDRALFIVGQPRKLPHRWYQSLGIRRQKYISMLEPVDDQIRHLREEKPDFLVIDSSCFPILAAGLKKLIAEGIRPRIVTTGGSILTEERREAMESMFGVRVLDYHSSWEFGNIAWECRRQAGYHVNAEGFIVEVIQNGRRALPKERGEIVITDLNAYAMPFIRYKLEDVSALSRHPCPCGRGLPLLEKIEGRINDLIRLPNGRVVLPAGIARAFRLVSGISQYQFVQEGENEFRVSLVKGEGFCPTTPENVEKALRQVLGADIRLHTQIVDEIPRDPSGKLRAFLSKVLES